MKTIKQITFYSLLFLATTGCIENFIIDGNGIPVTEVRPANNFNKVISSGDFEVYITKGMKLEVVVNAEQNILPYIETTFSENTLLISQRSLHNFKTRLPMKVYVTLPVLTGVNQSGSGLITTDYFSAERIGLFVSGSGSITTSVDANIVDASISGSGWLKITGDATESNLTISGPGNINSHNLMVNNCNAIISGSGYMQVYALKAISARISGSGNVYYTGNPGVETKISGSGKVIREF